MAGQEPAYIWTYDWIDIGRFDFFSWFLDFIQSSVEGLAIGQLVDLSHKIRLYALDQRLEILRPDALTEIPGLLSVSELTHIQNNLKKLFKNEIEVFLYPQQEELEGPIPELPTPVEIPTPYEGNERRVISLEMGVDDEEYEFMFRIRNKSHAKPIDAEHLWRSLREATYDALSMANPKNFRKCRHCAKWMYSERKKRFCSFQCNTRYNAARQREKLKKKKGVTTKRRSKKKS